MKVLRVLLFQLFVTFKDGVWREEVTSLKEDGGKNYVWSFYRNGEDVITVWCFRWLLKTHYYIRDISALYINRIRTKCRARGGVESSGMESSGVERR